MEKHKIEDLKTAAYWIAVNYQQSFYEISSDWNKYNLNEHLYLKNYIGYGIYGCPENEEVVDNEEIGDNDINCVYIYKEKGAMDMIEIIFNKVIEHGTQMTEEKEVLCSILYICVYDKNLLTDDQCKLQELIHVKPIFKVQKCINSTNLQIWYIDTEGRVYKDWKDYLTNNNLPTCTMIVPKNGFYQANLREVWSNIMSPVWVETHDNHKIQNITNAVDLASTLVNFGCVGIGIAAMFNPISAPIAIAGAVGGTVSGVWGGGRAIHELVDRGTHDQSISITNKDALPAWLGVAGSTLGLAASSGSALLSRAIRTGTTVGKSAQLAHDAILVSNLFVNSIGIGYNSVNMAQKYMETGEISTKDIFFLTAHVFFVCNSAMKMKLASEIIKSDQNQILKEYENSLRSKRHQKEFRRLVRNTGSQITDEVHRNEQIIRSLTKISNKDEFFATMTRNRKLFSSTGTQLSFSDGQVQINDVTLINPSTFACMSKDNIISLINQASDTTNYSSVNPSTSTGNIISPNILKAGISAVREFCVKKAVSSTATVEIQTKNYRNIINDIQHIPKKNEILEVLLKSGLCIVRKIISQPNYNEEELLSDATNFIWNIAKCSFAKSMPGINMFEKKFNDIVMVIVKTIYKYIKANSNEWVDAFQTYMLSFSNDNKQNKNFEMTEHSRKQNNRDTGIKYNEIILLDNYELMSLQKEVIMILIQEAINATGSKMINPGRLSPELVEMCKDELNNFFLVHSPNLKFNTTKLAEALKGILIDLKEFENRDILFYKLIVIAVNVSKKVVVDGPLTQDILVDVMKFIWIIVNLNFSQTYFEISMIQREYEGLVMNILIALYKYQIAESEKWLSAFLQYKLKYCRV